jgi:hypothetical protein
MQTAICFQDVKVASLYFDRVLPVAFRHMAGTGSDIVTEFPEPISSRVLVNVVFDKIAPEGPARYRDFGRIIDSWGSFMKEAHVYLERKDKSSVDENYTALSDAYMQDACRPGSTSIRKLFAKYACSLGFQHPGVLLPPRADAFDIEQEDVIVALCNLQLIDAEQVPWEQIVELRADADARIRLQRLRAFAQTNYQGKPASFIEDDLSSRIDEYAQAASKHGFELVTGTLTTLLDSSTLITAAGASLAAAYFGGPATAFSAALCIELGKASLEFAKRKRSMVDWEKSHPVAYLIEARALSN